jgi:hypothetical protein
LEGVKLISIRNSYCPCITVKGHRGMNPGGNSFVD